MKPALSSKDGTSAALWRCTISPASSAEKPQYKRNP